MSDLNIRLSGGLLISGRKAWQNQQMKWRNKSAFVLPLSEMKNKIFLKCVTGGRGWGTWHRTRMLETSRKYVSHMDCFPGPPHLPRLGLHRRMITQPMVYVFLMMLRPAEGRVWPLWEPRPRPCLWVCVIASMRVTVFKEGSTTS